MTNFTTEFQQNFLWWTWRNQVAVEKTRWIFKPTRDETVYEKTRILFASNRCHCSTFQFPN